jgi:hypothetical protein
MVYLMSIAIARKLFKKPSLSLLGYPLTLISAIKQTYVPFPPSYITTFKMDVDYYHPDVSTLKISEAVLKLGWGILGWVDSKRGYITININSSKPIRNFPYAIRETGPGVAETNANHESDYIHRPMGARRWGDHRPEVTGA